VVPANIFNLSNHPNPFNPTTEICFELASSSIENTEIEIYNIKGQRIREFKMDNVKCKMNKIIWNGTDQNNNPVASGVYFLNLKIGNELRAVKKCLLLK